MGGQANFSLIPKVQDKNEIRKDMAAVIEKEVVTRNNKIGARNGHHFRESISLSFTSMAFREGPFLRPELRAHSTDLVLAGNSTGNDRFSGNK